MHCSIPFLTWASALKDVFEALHRLVKLPLTPRSKKLNNSLNIVLD